MNNLAVSVEQESETGRSNRGHSAYDGVLTPDAILPSQFYGSRRGSAENEPLRRLMFAVLEDAVRTFMRNFGSRSGQKRLEFVEADHWLFKNKDDGPFSLDSVCHVVGISPGDLRRRLLLWRSQKIAQSRSAAGNTASSPSFSTAQRGTASSAPSPAQRPNASPAPSPAQSRGKVRKGA